MPDETHCPLCAAVAVAPYHADARREYLQCGVCALVFVPPRDHLDRAAERAEYDRHCNDPADQGYRAFLSRLSEPLLANVAAGARGLDFGCGPGPALAAMLGEAGMAMTLYDPFYAPDAAALTDRYDFITATEVVEHLREPGAELRRLWSLLSPGGWLGVMTKLVLDREAFGRWHYIRDPTHICFFSEATWRWWAAQRGAAMQVIGADVVLFRKQSGAVDA